MSEIFEIIKFLSLKVIPALILLTIFAPAKVESSMKDAYKQNNADKLSCNSNTANFATTIPSNKELKYMQVENGGWETRQVKVPAYKEYYCVLQNGKIMTFSDRKTSPVKFGSTKETSYIKPQVYENGYVSTGTRKEYSVEGDSLI